MAWWIYKCNSTHRYGRKSSGDWHKYFAKGHTVWGNSKERPALADLKKGDIVIAHQSNRRELVGIARVTQSCDRDTWLHLKAIQQIGAYIPDLKESDSKIAEIPALQAGPIQTIYNILDSDAHRLLRAAGVSQALLSRLQRNTPPSYRSTVSEAATFRGGGESQQHRKLKRYVAKHPGILRLPLGLVGRMEYALPSGDSLDVLFEYREKMIGVEVKSKFSPEADIARGIFQCVKYRALIEAYQTSLKLPQNARTVLVLEGPLPGRFILLKNMLGVEVIDNATLK